MARLDGGVPDYWEAGGRLPYFRDPWAVLRAALDALAPPRRVSVSEIATRRHVRVGACWRPFDPDVAPYMREPMDVVASRRFRELAFAGPARSLKTQCLVHNPIAHAVLAAPRTVHVVLQSQQAAALFHEEELMPTVRNSPELAARLRSSRLDRMTFGGTARVTLGWPVAQQLRGRTIPLVLMPDYDASPDNVEGEGDLFGLATKRGESEGSAAMAVAESSPAKPPLEDDDSGLTGPHELPRALGVVGLYNGGSRGWLYWPCPDCGEHYSPRFELLHYDASLEPAEAGQTAVMVCPHCGSMLEPRHKAERLRLSEWRHEARGGGLTDIGGAVRGLPRASYWLDGTAACFATWGDLVRRFEVARRHADETGDEAPLQRVTNVDLGRPYRLRAKRAAEGLTPAAIRALAVAVPWGVCPEETAALTIQVDVQAARFAVQVEAVRPGLAVQLVDRFDLTEVPEGAPGRGRRALDPGRYVEDWRALDELLTRSWPVMGQGYRLRAVAIACDAGGAPGVTPNAYATFRRLRREHGKRFRLVRGRTKPPEPRATEAAPETVHNSKRRVARDVRLIWAQVDRLKDELLAALLRDEDGPGAYRVPRETPDDVVAEFCAERRTDAGWEMRPGQQRNESLDLAVYGRALRIVLGAERIDWSRPPAWALSGAGNAWAAPAEPGSHVADRPAVAAPAVATPPQETSRRPDPVLAHMQRLRRRR